MSRLVANATKDFFLRAGELLQSLFLHFIAANAPSLIVPAMLVALPAASATTDIMVLSNLIATPRNTKMIPFASWGHVLLTPSLIHHLQYADAKGVTREI